MTVASNSTVPGREPSGLRLSAWRFVGPALSVAAAVAVTSQAFSAPPKPRKVQDFVVTEGMQPQFAAICQMYPAECRFNADGSVARVTGRRVAPGATDRSVLRHFQTEIGTIQDANWRIPQ